MQIVMGRLYPLRILILQGQKPKFLRLAFGTSKLGPCYKPEQAIATRQI